MWISRECWRRFGDVFFKLMIIGWLVGSVVAAVRILRFVPGCLQIFPLWQTIGLVGVAVCTLLLVTLPVLTGLFLRRRWACDLWFVLLVLNFFSPLIRYLGYGPFSPKNSFPAICGSIVATVLLLALNMNRSFRLTMNRSGGRVWLKISGSVLVASILFFSAFGIWWIREFKSASIEVVEVPSASMDGPLEDGWTEVALYGLMIPVPLGTTNDFHVGDEGVEVNSFANKNDEHTYSLTFMTDDRPLYSCLPEIYGINSLERDFQHRYELSVLISAMYRMTQLGDNGTTYAGFRSGESFDLMVRVWKNERGAWMEVDLEKKPSKKHYQVILRSVEPLTIEELFRLVSRIRLASE